MIFLVSVVVSLMLYKPSLKNVLAFFGIAGIGTVFLVLVFHSQVEYIINTLSRFDLETIPRYRALLNWFENPSEYMMLQTFLVGNGVGGLGSRTSFILSGEYLWAGALPMLGVAMTESFQSVMLPLWNKEITDNLYISGTYYMPFSTYTSIFLEYGALTLLLFCFAIVKLVFLFRSF